MSGLHCETNLLMSATNATTHDELLANMGISPGNSNGGAGVGEGEGVRQQSKGSRTMRNLL